ncbi:aminoacylase-1 [Pelobates cultripes]|uniref:N-acyl-aliphatic-L-amino acid amidohydrolase n=2 Tax=Pelobates cultripes TaxID=61616 RepID=A0AAD1WLU2_PELCU|nr:aminoacylase-1 [Pelobates cultripes]
MQSCRVVQSDNIRNCILQGKHPQMDTSSKENAATSLFREYLRIRTVHPEPDYDAAEKFLVRVAEDIGLKSRKLKMSSGRTIIIMTWPGTEPQLKSVILNSHIDVVPVDEEFWTYPPFEAHKDDSGNIYARGTQDMKCVTIQYLEALRELKSKGFQFPRTIYLTLVPDEETGGHTAMELLVRQPEFEELNPGITLDEGLASPTEEFSVFYGEKCPWWITVHCPGDPGHGSRFIENSAASKLHFVITKFLEFREKEKQKLESDPKLTLGDVTSVNLTKVSGGISYNVVPSEMSATFDLRVPPTLNLKEFESQIEGWCREAGSDVTWEYHQKCMNQNVTSTDDSYPWWKAFSSPCKELGLKLKPEIFPAGTDSRYIREVGYPAIGFSPINHTPILLHDHNEYLNEDVFLRGIHIYTKIITSLASVPAFDGEH